MLNDNERMVLRKFLYNRKNLREFNISSVQQCILLAMLDHKTDITLTQKQIAKEIDCAQSCISKQMNRLAGSGFLKRFKHTTKVYGTLVSFNVYKPTEAFYKMAKKWYDRLDKDKEEVAEDNSTPKVTKVPKEESKTKIQQKLAAMSNISLKPKSRLWDDIEGEQDV
mgnify:CR=1 FL=1